MGDSKRQFTTREIKPSGGVPVKINRLLLLLFVFVRDGVKVLVLPSSLRGRASLAVNSFLELGRSFNLYLTADIDTCASPPAILIPEDRAEKSPRTAQEYLPT